MPRMVRTNVSLPDDLVAAAKAAELNVSALVRQAIVHELDRRAKVAALHAWLDELDEIHGAPSAEEMAEGKAWARGVLNAPTATELAKKSRSKKRPVAKSKATPKSTATKPVAARSRH